MNTNKTAMTNDLSVAGPDWSDHELELFHDGELTGPEAVALSEALRVRPELRARLADITRADAAMLAAMTEERAGRVEGQGCAENGVAARIGMRPVVWAAAAVLVIAGSALLAVKMMSSGASGHGPVVARNDGKSGGNEERNNAGAGVAENRAGSGQVEASDEPYRAVRVVFSLPLKSGDTWGKTASASSATSERPRDGASARVDQPADQNRAAGGAGNDFIKRLDGALAAGRVDEAMAMMQGARAEDREKAYASFGAAMRSSRSATEVMDALEPAEQVAACRQWIAAGTQRQIAMERLRMLGRRAELEESVRIAVRGLIADDPSLRAWAMSYVPWAVEGAGKPSPEQG